MLKRDVDDEQIDQLELPGMPTYPMLPPEPPHDELAALALQLRCEHCKAAPDHWCRTKSGHGAANLHAARLLVVQTVFWLGFEHGHQAGETLRLNREVEGEG